MPDFTPYIAALPALGVVVKGVLSVLDSNLERRARRHSALLAQLPEGIDRRDVERLLTDELAEISRRGDKRLHRKLDGATVAALILVVTVGTAGSVGLWVWDPGWWTWEAYVLRPSALVVGLTTLLFIVVGVGDLWKDSRESAQDVSV